ncbi:RHS repeat-associated core domain-containing protein [Chryseobacterium vrystaatense]|uniref:RHS repeat-associated core domain-containing protein n=1 Tax=Chryseobacterium vrystaatense TaxID=307480 RepID=UPI001CC82B08|nr:RHS repeat-associated core domain-containing protein [Chryseobacterium vrystaatense]
MHNYTSTTQNAYQYKYNGKELQESGMYDYGVRFYMPDLARWGGIDPLAETTLQPLFMQIIILFFTMPRPV